MDKIQKQTLGMLKRTIEKAESTLDLFCSLMMEGKLNPQTCSNLMGLIRDVHESISIVRRELLSVSESI